MIKYTPISLEYSSLVMMLRDSEERGVRGCERCEIGVCEGCVRGVRRCERGEGCEGGVRCVRGV